jgi:chitodextrinase
MKLVCATLLAFVLVTPAAYAGPPKKPRDTTPPTVPTGLRVVAATEDSVTVRWNASTDNSGRILRYQVNGVYHEGNSTQKTITGLVPNYTLTVRVLAVDPTENYSGLSAPLAATTAPDVTAPTTPGNLRLTATNSPTSISLAWDRSTDRWSVGYQVFMDGAFFAHASSISTRLRKIPFGIHTFTVKARDTSGNFSGASNPITVNLPDTGDRTAPTAPSNLTAVSLEDFCGSVLLNWTQSTDNADAQSQIEYELYRNGVFHDLVTGAGSAFVYGGPGLSTWHVVAVDRSANSSGRSNTASVTTNADENLC